MLIRLSSSLPTASVSSLARNGTPCLRTLPFIARHNSTTSQAAEEAEAPAATPKRTIPLAVDLGGVDISRPRGGPRDSRGNGPRREGQQPRREGRPPNFAVSGGARPGGQTQRYNNGPRRDGRPPSGMASGEARQGGGQGQRPNNGARPDNRRPQNQFRPRGGPANANSNSATRPNRDGRRGERQSDRAPRSDSKEELKALEAAQAEQVFAAAYDKLKQGKLFNVDLGNVEDIFHPTIKAPTKQSSVKPKDSRALAEQARLADLRERAGDYSRYVRRLHERTDVAALGPVGLADLVLSHRRGIVPAERDKAIDVVQKLVGSGKGTTVTV